MATKPDAYPPDSPVVRRRGGWFVEDGVRGWSGPWATEDAAKMARAGDFDRARAMEKASK